jgi:hypothetical protein
VLRGRCNNDGCDAAVDKGLIERGKFVLYKPLVFSFDGGQTGFIRFEELSLGVSRTKVGAAGNVTAPCANFGIEPEKIDVDLVLLDKVFVITVGESRRDNFVLDGEKLLVKLIGGMEQFGA